MTINQPDSEIKLKNAQAYQRRLFQIIIILIVVCVILLTFGSIAVFQKNAVLQQVSTAQAANATAHAASTVAVAQQATAQANAQAAQIQATISRANELSAQSLALREKDFLMSMLLGLEAYKKSDSFYTKGILLDNIRANPQLKVYLSGYPKEVRSALFSPDGTILATGGFDNTIFLWDVQTGQSIGQPLIGPQPNVDAGYTGFITSLAFSPDGKILAAGSYDTTIVLWDVKTGKLIGAPLTEHSFSISSVAFSPDGSMLVSTTCGPPSYCEQSNQEKAILWDVKTMQPIEKIQSGSLNAAFSPNGNILALVGDEKNTILLWDIKDRKVNKKLLAGERVYKLIFFPDGKLASVVLGDNKYLMILWDINTGQQISSEPFTIGSSTYVFSADGNTLISAYRGDIGQTDMKTHQSGLFAWLRESYSLDILALSPDGNTVAVIGRDRKTVILLNKFQPYQPIGKRLLSQLFNNRLLSDQYLKHLVFSSDGNFLFSANQAGFVTQWDIASDPPAEKLVLSDYQFKDVYGTNATSPDGNIQASGNLAKGSIVLLDKKSGKKIKTLRKDGIFRWDSIAFSMDGKILVSKGNYSDIVLWDVESGQPIGEPLTGQIFVFSPDGNTLAATSSEHIVLWDINPQSWVAKTCQRVGRNFTRMEWAKYFPGELYRATCPQWSLEAEP